LTKYLLQVSAAKGRGRHERKVSARTGFTRSTIAREPEATATWGIDSLVRLGGWCECLREFLVKCLGFKNKQRGET